MAERKLRTDQVGDEVEEAQRADAELDAAIDAGEGEAEVAKMQAVEDEFFGEKDVLSGEVKPVESFREDTHTAVSTVTLGQDPERVIDDLQAGGHLPESIYTRHLVTLLKLLGEKFKMRIKLGDKVLFPGNDFASIDLSLDQAAKLLKGGIAASAFLIPTLVSQTALAGPLQPGMSPNADVFYMLNWDNAALLALLLTLLGVSAVAIAKIAKKYKKTEEEKEAHKAFSKYQEAKKNKDPGKAKVAKKALYAHTMGQLPTKMNEAIANTDITSEDDLKQAFKYKKKVDTAISNATSDVTKAMVLPEDKTVENLNAKKEEVLALLDNHIMQLQNVYNELVDEWVKLDKQDPKTKYLLAQLEHEKAKLAYYIEYLVLMKKKWLMLIQSAKNDVIKGMDPKLLSAEDALAQELANLQNQLNDLLNNQSGLSTADFAAQLAALGVKLDEKGKKAAEKGIPGYGTEEKLIGPHTLVLHNDGKYDHSTGIKYAVDGTEKHLDLAENFNVQIWVNEKKEIHINVVHKGVTANHQLLKISGGDLVVADSGKSLKEFLEEMQSSDDIRALEASLDLPPEAAPILQAVADAHKEVSGQIKDNKYKLFGRQVEADDKAIRYHLVRVHREFYQGQSSTVVRFTLSESEWKKALANLDKQNDVPKHNVNFNYQNEEGGIVTIDQPMRRFNITVDDKQATVLVPSNEKYPSLAGEIRIIFPTNVEYTEKDVKAVFAEACMRLGIQEHIKPVTDGARKALQEQLREIRKESHAASGKKDAVHPEYTAEEVQPVSVTKLRNLGLHSVYHQFSADALEKIFKAGQLMSTTTRWSKGVLTHGMSSTGDMVKGSGGQVFTRVHTKSSAKNGSWYAGGKPALVFKPELLERLDVYCFTSDKYGSQLPGTFQERVSPEALVSQMASGYHNDNEVMFFDAVSLEDAEYLVCDNPAQYIQRLKAIGVTKIGGKPLEEAVITPAKFQSIKL